MTLQNTFLPLLEYWNNVNLRSEYKTLTVDSVIFVTLTNVMSWSQPWMHTSNLKMASEGEQGIVNMSSNLIVRVKDEVLGFALC